MSNFRLYQIVLVRQGNTDYGTPGVIRRFINKNSKDMIEVWHLIGVSLLHEPKQLFETNFSNSDLEKMRSIMIANDQR